MDQVVDAGARWRSRAGLDGVVASPLETAAIRARCGGDFLVVTPGIRGASAGAEKNDQSRTMGPAEAVSAGASYIVVGRPIIAAADPRAGGRSHRPRTGLSCRAADSRPDFRHTARPPGLAFWPKTARRHGPHPGSRLAGLLVEETQMNLNGIDATLNQLVQQLPKGLAQREVKDTFEALIESLRNQIKTAIEEAAAEKASPATAPRRRRLPPTPLPAPRQRRRYRLRATTLRPPRGQPPPCRRISGRSCAMPTALSTINCRTS